MSKLTVSRRLGATAAIAAGALAVAGCGSSNVTASRAKPAAAGAKIARAADVSGAALGEKVSYALTEKLPSLGTISVSGTGVFNNSPADGSMTVNVSAPNASGLGGLASSLLSNLKLSLVYDSGDLYLKLPSELTSLASSYTDGKSWLEADLTQLASESKLPGLSNLLSGGHSIDPTTALAQLEAAATNGVTKVGTATVDGVATTEYRGTLDLDKLTGLLPAGARAKARQNLARYARRSGATAAIPFDVYVDGDNLVRRLTVSATPSSPQGTKIPVSLTLDFLSYGAQPAPAVPSASETDNVDSLLTKLGSMAGARASWRGLSDRGSSRRDWLSGSAFGG